MKKTDASIPWAFAALSVAILAGCFTAGANIDRTTVQAKGSLYLKPKQKPGSKKTRRKKKEALLGQRVVISGHANMGSKPSAKSGSVHFVCVPKCYVRQTPDNHSPAIAELLEYDWVKVLKTKSSWCQVQTGAGSVGWLSQSLIK
jgi:Bacterial SH3 domain